MWPLWNNIVIVLVLEAAPRIDMIAGTGIVNLPLVIARSKTFMLKVVNAHNLVLVLVLQAVLAIFTFLQVTGMQPMFNPKNVAKLNSLLHPDNNKKMVNQTILTPVQPNHH